MNWLFSFQQQGRFVLRYKQLVPTSSKKSWSWKFHVRPSPRGFTNSSSSSPPRKQQEQQQQQLDDDDDDDDNDQSKPKPTTTVVNDASMLLLAQQLSSWPNRITLVRMASTPLLAYWIIHDCSTYALWGCGFAALTDYGDGHLAKHYNMKTPLGTYLDPLADKILINGLAISLTYKQIIPWELMMLWLGKDSILICGTGYYLQQQTGSINFLTNAITTSPLQVQPSTIGKVNTALQFVTIGIGIGILVLHPDAPSPLADSAAVMTATTEAAAAEVATVGTHSLLPILEPILTICW